CVYFYFIFWIIAACGRTGGLYLISVRCGRFSATNQHKKTQKCKHSHTKLFAEVQAANFGIICQVAWLARTKNLALGHYVRAVRYAKSFAHVVVGDENPDTTISEIEYYILNIVYCFWIYAGERFIEQDILRLSCEGSCDFGAPPLAT